MAKLKMTKELTDELCDLIAKGVPKKRACYGAGITEPTLYGWLSKGEKDAKDGKNTKFFKFFKRVKKAEADFIGSRLSNIRTAGDEGSWQADAWLLERGFPNEFGRRNAVELSGDQQNPVQVEEKVVETYQVQLPDNGRDDT